METEAIDGGSELVSHVILHNAEHYPAPDMSVTGWVAHLAEIVGLTAARIQETAEATTDRPQYEVMLHFALAGATALSAPLHFEPYLTIEEPHSFQMRVLGAVASDAAGSPCIGGTAHEVATERLAHVVVLLGAIAASALRLEPDESDRRPIRELSLGGEDPVDVLLHSCLQMATAAIAAVDELLDAE